MPTAPLTVNPILYALPLAELLVCALVWLALRSRANGEGGARGAPFLTAFGPVWIALVLVDMVWVAGLTPTMRWRDAPLAYSLLYPQLALIAAVLIVRAIAKGARAGSGRTAAGLVAAAQILGLAWTEFFRFMIAGLAD